MRLSELQNKVVVDVSDGKNIGNIIDVIIDSDTGNIISFILEPNKSLFKLVRSSNTEIDWKSITKIGEDVILVKMGF